MIKILTRVALFLLACQVNATVLPEDRSDLLYHSYDGGGVTIDGPSLLVRKELASNISISGNYYIDYVSSASIDVEVSGASRYTEERKEYSFNADYLHEKTIMSAGFTTSLENDYEADTWFFGVSQDFFGDLSTLTLSYASGSDIVMQTGNESLREEAERQNLKFGWSQVLTANLLLSLNYEVITEEGYLNNPYRSYRFIDPLNPNNTVFETEVYPDTRTSDAAAIAANYYLPWRAALHFHYRYFTDDWDIEAHTYTLGYTHPLSDKWILDLTYRAYNQSNAYFYSDLHEFQAVDDKDFRARDKELSEYTSQTLGFGVSYDFKIGSGRLIQKSSINLQYDYLTIDYDNFRDARVTDVNPGDEPLYSQDANVVRLFFSIWY